MFYVSMIMRILKEVESHYPCTNRTQVAPVVNVSADNGSHKSHVTWASDRSKALVQIRFLILCHVALRFLCCFTDCF